MPKLRACVVENDSGDAEALREIVARETMSPWVDLVIAERNGGFAYGNNRAVEFGRTLPEPPDYYLILNPDTIVHPGAVQILVDFLETFPSVGIAGSSFENADGSDWPHAFRFPSIWSEVESGLSIGFITRLLQSHQVTLTMPKVPAPVDWICGASMLVRRRAWEDVNGMDEAYFLYFEEVDFCRRVKEQGWPCWYVPGSRVTHIAGQSTGLTKRDDLPPRLPGYWFESRRRYFVKNHGIAYAICADAASATAFSIGHIKRSLRGEAKYFPPNFVQDLLRHSPLLPSNWAAD